MRSNNYKSVLKHAGLAASVLLLASGAAFGQVSLTAGPANALLPDGTSVPMWGYTCTAATAPTTCAALNTTAATAGQWSPVVITVPTGQDLTITLTNSLTFAGGNIPTSLVIVGQLGGGLGTTATSTASPDHSNAQPLTWPIAGDPAGAPLTGVWTPPVQGTPVQSFSTEVAVGTPAPLCWGVCGTGGPALKPGTYLIESGTHPSIQGPMGLYGILVVTDTTTTPAATAYPAVGTTAAVTYNADIPLLLSEIDPVQNAAVQAAVGTTGFSETKVWSGLYGGCGNPVLANGNTNPTFQTCYPPAVNYTPLYYLTNGRVLDKTAPAASVCGPRPATGAGGGTVLVRRVSAGLRMHVPSIVGAQPSGTAAVSGFSLIAEDGNVLPGLPRVQSEVFMPAGKTQDVMINVPAAGATALPIFDRELSLSGNAVARDAGMLAYIGANGAVAPVAAATATANADTYNSVLTGQTLTVLDPGKGLLANDINVFGAHVVGTAPAGLTLNSDGTFTYTAGTPTSFTYCGNGATSGAACALVNLGAAPLEAGSGITMNGTSYTAHGTFLKIQPPGVLAFDKDGAGYPLTVNAASVAGAGFTTLAVDPNGGFSASAACTVATGCPVNFTYNAQNSQGTVSSASATVTVTFFPATGLSVTVLDGKDVLAAKTNSSITPTHITDYRWVIEEDRTFYVDPNCTTNPPAAGCPGATTPGVGTTGIVPTFGANFHTSYMQLIAAGCTGTLSCEGGQSIFNHATGTHDLAVFIFKDDYPLIGEQDGGGGLNVLSQNEPGLGGFNIMLFDVAGGTGDATGQMTYDMFKQPLSTSLEGTIDPATGLDACPVTKISRIGPQFDANGNPIAGTLDPT